MADVYQVNFVGGSQRRVTVERHDLVTGRHETVIWMPENPFSRGWPKGMKHEEEMLALANICARALTKEQPTRNML